MLKTQIPIITTIAVIGKVSVNDCQCEKYSDSEYFSNTVKSTSKSYQSLKEDSQSSDDENKIKSYPRNGKHEFGNKFTN